MINIKKIYVIIPIIMIAFLLYANANDDLRIANELMGQREFDEAFIQVNHIITEYPNTPQSYEARLLLAEINLERELYQEARIQLLLLLRNPFLLSFDQRARTYSLLGLVLFKENQFEAAIEMYDRLFLDYRDTSEAQKAFTYYFDCFYALGDYQSVIVKTRELMNHYRNDEILAELLYHQANAYFMANMTEQTNRAINEIRTKYAHTMAAWRAYEIQVLLHEREQGKQAAATMLEQILTQSIARIVEENLSWLLVHYYLDLNETAKARQKIDFIVGRFTLSENISKYHLLWLKLLSDEMDIRPILTNEDYIITASRNKPEYHSIVYYIAKTRFLAQDYWRARYYLDANIDQITDDSLKFDYRFLYAEILSEQGQYVNSIEILNSLLNQYNHIGRNYDVLMALGDINLLHLSQDGQALNFYRQATNLAITTAQSLKALQMTAQCLQQLGQYSEALSVLNQIPIDNIIDTNLREQIINQITLFHIFYVSDPSDALTRYLILNTNNNISIIDKATLLSVHLKQYNDALNILSTPNNYETRMERIKLNLLLAYKNLLENNNPETDRYIAALNSEVSQLGSNIQQSDRALINGFRGFISARGRITQPNLENIITFTNSDIINPNAIDLRNFFRFQLWKYYYENNNTPETMQVAQYINQDAFVGKMDYQRVNIMLASHLYENQSYEQAIIHFHKADRFLSIGYADFYYQYAMSLYETRQTIKALEILQKLVLNNIENENLTQARDLIVNYWINNNRLEDALDILNQIPPLKRDDSDYRNFMKVYYLQNNPQREKDALLFIRTKSVEDYQRLAQLHLLTGDKETAEATWREILRTSEQTHHRLNAYAGLGNLFYQDEKYAEANRNYDEYFKIFTRTTPTDDLLIPPIETLKEHIIACLMTNNRPKAETVQKNFSFLISNNDHDFHAEIKLYEGIYYVRMEPRRAERPLSQVIEDGKISEELVYKALFWRGTLYLQENKISQAETDLLSALNTSDEKLKNQVRLKLGTLYYQQENFEMALQHYYDVIMNDMEGTLAKDAANNFAITARAMQQWNMAIAAYQVIMDRWGQTHLDIESRITIGFSFYMAKEYDQAINLLNQLFPELKTVEHRAEAQFWIAESHLKNGNYEIAEEGFRQIKTTHRVARWIELADLKIAETYIYRGDTERGRTLLNEVIRTQGANSDAGKEATRLLQEL